MLGDFTGFLGESAHERDALFKPDELASTTRNGGRTSTLQGDGERYAMDVAGEEPSRSEEMTRIHGTLGEDTGNAVVADCEMQPDMEDIGGILDRILDTTGGILRLKPNYVRRYYRDAGRLRPATKARVAAGRKQSHWVPERWIASTVIACNPDPVHGEGLSILDIPGRQISLKDALAIRGEQLLGPRLAARYAPQFPVLSKVLDPYDPIMFHFHARDEDVLKFPEHFAPNSTGKEEAYYFLPGPKGRTPYTHVGLRPGVTKQELIHAIEKGADYALDLSPVFAQRFEDGFHVPAGIPHRPGTALTLEIQQPSDIFTHLDWFSGGRRLSPEQTHPGFHSLDEALDFIDWQGAEDPHILDKYRLVPEPVRDTQQREQGEEVWIFPPRTSRKFSGKRVRITGTFEVSENLPSCLQGHSALSGASCHHYGGPSHVGADGPQRPRALERAWANGR